MNEQEYLVNRLCKMNADIIENGKTGDRENGKFIQVNTPLMLCFDSNKIKNNEQTEEEKIDLQGVKCEPRPSDGIALRSVLFV